jgi:hypothetical protein
LHFVRFRDDGIPIAIGFCEFEDQCEAMFRLPLEQFRDAPVRELAFAEIDDLSPQFARTRHHAIEERTDEYDLEPYLVVQGAEPDVLRLWRDYRTGRAVVKPLELVGDTLENGSVWRLVYSADGVVQVPFGVSLTRVGGGWRLESRGPSGFLGSIHDFLGEYNERGQLVGFGRDVNVLAGTAVREDWPPIIETSDVTHVYDGDRLIRSEYLVDQDLPSVAIFYEYDGCDR